MEIDEKIDGIENVRELAEFIRALGEDFSQNRSEWENQSVDGYLEAISGWLLAMAREDKFTCQLRDIANLLYIGKIYE